VLEGSEAGRAIAASGLAQHHCPTLARNLCCAVAASIVDDDDLRECLWRRTKIIENQR
jgi:hypothetical protein